MGLMIEKPSLAGKVAFAPSDLVPDYTVAVCDSLTCKERRHERPREALSLTVKVILTTAALFLLFVPGLVRAQDSDLAEANRAIANPLTNNVLFITETDTFRQVGDITNRKRWANVTIVEPLIPVSIGDTGWTLITRPIIPVGFGVDVPEFDGTGFTFKSKSGLGDAIFFALATPGMNEKGFQWGIGPTLQMPTATDDALGSEKWSIGPAAIVVYNTSVRRPGDLTVGFLNQNFFSFAGDSDREDVDVSTLQYFATWSITDNWGFLTAPTIRWDREASSGNKWSIPISAGISYTTKLGNIPTRFVLEPQYFVKRPDDYGADWNIRFAVAMFLPKPGG